MRVNVIGDWTQGMPFFTPAFYGSIMESTELELSMEDDGTMHA